MAAEERREEERDRDGVVRKYKEKTEMEKHDIYQFLLRHLAGGMLRSKSIEAAAEHGRCSTSTVKRIWYAAKRQSAKGERVSFPNLKKRVKGQPTSKLDVQRVRALSVLERSSIRGMASHLGMSKSSLHRCIKRKELRPHTNAVKPSLTETNKIGRLKFSLSHLVHDTANSNFRFQTMQNIIHIDEKWFYITNTSARYYLLPEEEEPYRSCQSKRFITKVMFLCAVARPHFSEDGAVLWDGKIGIFPFTTQVPAARGSKNRPKGTLETKPIHHVTKEVTKDCLINKLIPAIKEKWPSNYSRDIVIQQDNAKPHMQIADEQFVVAALSAGFNIRLVCQPPNSPDMNVNDLGYFRAIQSLQTVKKASNVDELVQNVRLSYEELTADTLNKVFLTLQTVFIEVMKEKGGNGYKIPHVNKNRLLRMGELPLDFTVDRGLIKECLDYLQVKDLEMGCGYDVQHIRTALGF